MPLTRERPRTPAFPPPAPLPSLSDALARRAAVFGPVEIDEAPVPLRGPCQVFGAALRRMANTCLGAQPSNLRRESAESRPGGRA